MSFVDKLKTRLVEIKQMSEIKAAEFVAPTGIAADRLTICLGCEHLFHPTNTCKKCGCFVHAKTKLTNATCPVGKW